MMCIDTSRGPSTLCSYPDCTRQVWQDPDGSYSCFCGNTHRESMINLIESRLVCKICRARPVYVENESPHEFCGVRCATQHKYSQRLKAEDISLVPEKDKLRICKLSTCNKPVFIGPHKEPAQYCSQTHRVEAVKKREAEACLLCGKYPKNTVNDRAYDFCSKTCGQQTMGQESIMLQVPAADKTFESVSQQFYTQWKHPTYTPRVIKIWKIFCSQEPSNAFVRYKLSVERRTGLIGGNTRRRFHGTIRSCRIGDTDERGDFCGQSTCSLCGIIQSSFEKTKSGQRTNFGRFGAGIYTSATSSKANDYVWERGGSPYKTMLLNEVVMGKIIKLTVDSPRLTESPKGFDSVVGEPGSVLNYDESIVYKNEAIRPLYLIVYDGP